MKISDFRGLFTKSNIKLISRSQKTSDIYSFEFEANGNVDWKAGQHGIFKFIDKKINGKKFRAFSVASIKDENKIIIATRINDNPSDFKRHLKELKIGDEINMVGPFGWFYIKDYDKPMAMIAGGVGIPPIRALLKDIEKNSTGPKAVEVFYIDSKEEYAFKEELESIDKKYSSINVHFISNRDDFQAAVNKFANKYKNEAYYFVSGSPKMIKGVKQNLKQQGVRSNRLVNDPFYGY